MNWLIFAQLRGNSRLVEKNSQTAQKNLARTFSWGYWVNFKQLLKSEAASRSSSLVARRFVAILIGIASQGAP